MKHRRIKALLLVAVSGGVLLQASGCLLTALQFIIQDLAGVALSQFISDAISQVTGSAT